MATITEKKSAPQKEELLKIARDAIEIFRDSLGRGDYVVEIHDSTITTKMNTIKAYLSKRSLFILYGDIDIYYNTEKTRIILFDNKTIDVVARYDTPELHGDMAQLHEYALKKVKEKIEKALREI